MNFIIKFVPLMISLIALAFTGAGWWINREKLRLDLYNRRFEIYCRVLDLLFAFENWNPTGAETTACSLQDSPELDRALKAFTKAYRESQFLFDEKSGVHRQRRVGP